MSPFSLSEKVGVRASIRSRSIYESAIWCAILASAIYLRAFGLGTTGSVDPFYAATVRSMLDSPRNLVYAAFEPGGSVSVDKPPLAFWLQAFSAHLLGFNSLALDLPAALASIGGVLLAMAAVTADFGAIAGLCAGAVLAVAPIAVADARTNGVDSLLVLFELAAVAAALRGARARRLRWFVIAGASLGLAIEVKDLVALVALPAVLVAAGSTGGGEGRSPIGSEAVKATMAAVFTAAIVGCAWPALVWLTPPIERPMVMHSPNNSIWEQMVLYNGLGAVASPVGLPAVALTAGRAEQAIVRQSPGPLLLFEPAHATQLGIILVAAVVALLVRVRDLFPGTNGGSDRVPERLALRVWGAWLIAALVAFSWSSRLAPQYLEALAPPAAAVIGAALGRADWSLGRHAAVARLAAVTLVESAYVLVVVRVGIQGSDVWPIARDLGAGGLVAASATVAMLAVGGTSHAASDGIRRGATALAAACLVGVPLALSLAIVAPSLVAGTDGQAWPAIDVAMARDAYQRILARSGAPSEGAAGAAGEMTAPDPATLARALAEIDRAGPGKPILVAVAGYGTAARIVLATNRPVLVYFDEFTDRPAPSADELGRAFASGQVAYFLAPEGLDRLDPGTAAWARSNLTDVSGHAGLPAGRLYADRPSG